MKIVVQRVKNASVTVNGEITGKIGHGLLLLVGIHADDTEEQLDWCCNKIMKLRIFNDQEGLMNRSVQDVEGEILVVSQFTIYGDTRKGTRPGFTEAAPPGAAEPLYERMIQIFRERTNLNIETGRFGAMMEVELVNDGPVTLIINKEA